MRSYSNLAVLARASSWMESYSITLTLGSAGTRVKTHSAQGVLKSHTRFSFHFQWISRFLTSDRRLRFLLFVRCRAVIILGGDWRSVLVEYGENRSSESFLSSLSLRHSRISFSSSSKWDSSSDSLSSLSSRSSGNIHPPERGAKMNSSAENIVNCLFSWSFPSKISWTNWTCFPK